MDIEITHDPIGAAAFFAVLVYPEQTKRSFEKRDQLVDSIMYLGSRQEGHKPSDMAAMQGLNCEDFSRIELRRCENRLDTANKILIDKVMQAVFWIQVHGITGTKMFALWDQWKANGNDIGERARKEVFTPFKPILRLAFSFATVGVEALDKNNVQLNILSACRGYKYWLKDVVEDSDNKLTLFKTNPMIEGRKIFDHRLRIASEKSLTLKISSVEITPTRNCLIDTSPRTRPNRNQPFS
nr:hypothetical protein [Vibrio splendidus]